MSLIIDRITLRHLISTGSEKEFQSFYQKYTELTSISEVLTGAVAPTFTAAQHQWYLDTVTNKYYRNVDGGTTWVALN